ncbi:LLM class flavin-dependent oxidoreductase [Novosphingobium sp. FSY-8]|uniref:LLM class flavin-dependent oxidoreductase n=1 Tax=Novosphingobium ovatum TaxID=1908523 RepID=A0ABW9XBU4_9SPHN|nr:LLM class flavin-dependent oxidoreductase [Novosphingobium ovatum]NBC35972.1 LLM class flavin-dependent oxidoreductase [Novosphingobium ovatum]
MNTIGPIEIVGLIATTRGSEASVGNEPRYDPGFVAELARAYEAAGYDRVLVGQNARSSDSLVNATWVAAATQRLKLMVAHRPGFIAPTMAGRALATLDQLSGGRAGVHIITAFSDLETRNDGDWLTKDQRYERSQEYIRILRRMWAADAPFDHTGPYYRIEQAFTEVQPVRRDIPVFWAGTSPLALKYGAELADVYALGPGSVAQTAAQVATIEAEARRHDRRPRFSMSMRLVVGDTDAAAWDRATDLLRGVEARQAAQGLLGRELGAAALDVAQKAAQADAAGDDPCLWTGLTAATQGRIQVMCLVGSPDTLAAALLRYYHAGIDNFLITGFDWLPDTARIGTEVGARLRALTAAAPRPGTIA